MADKTITSAPALQARGKMFYNAYLQTRQLAAPAPAFGRPLTSGIRSEAVAFPCLFIKNKGVFK
jgi:hypothetical protein